MEKEKFIESLEHWNKEFVENTINSIESIRLRDRINTKHNFQIYFNDENHFGDYYWYQKEIEKLIDSHIFQYLILLFFRFANKQHFDPAKEDFYLNFASDDDTAYIVYGYCDDPKDYINMPNSIKHLVSVKWDNRAVDSNYLKSRKRYLDKQGIDITLITLRDFFVDFIKNEEFYDIYVKLTKDAINSVYKIVNFKSMPMLDNRYLYDFKKKLDILLVENSKIITKYTVINGKHKNENNEFDNRFINLDNESYSLYKIDTINENYLENKRYLALIGRNDYAKSFITSEYLFNQFNKENVFDYAVIVSGYLKSIEQLLYTLIFSYNNNETNKVFINSIVKQRKNKETNRYELYYYDKVTKEKVIINDIKNEDLRKIGRNDYLIRLTDDYKKYFSISLGSLIYFFNNNKGITYNDSYNYLLFRCLDCYRDECRNEFMHRSILEKDKWDYVNTIRNNTYFLYETILGMFKIDNSIDTNNLLGINDTTYDDICKIVLERYYYEFKISIDDKEYICRCLNQNKDFVCNDNGLINTDKLIFKIISKNCDNELNCIEMDRNNIPNAIEIGISFDENGKTLFFPVYKNKKLFDLNDYFKNREKNRNIIKL